MVCLILTETALFTIFVVAYLFYIGKSLTGPYPAQVLEMPILSTICLLEQRDDRAGRARLQAGDVGRFQLWWWSRSCLAAVFLATTATEWHRLITVHHLTISTNLFGTTFYSLVGLHASHVIVGVTLLTWSWSLASRGHGEAAASRARRDDLVVLALRGRGLGRRLHCGLRHRPLVRGERRGAMVT